MTHVKWGVKTSGEERIPLEAMQQQYSSFIKRGKCPRGAPNERANSWEHENAWWIEGMIDHHRRCSAGGGAAQSEEWFGVEEERSYTQKRIFWAPTTRAVKTIQD